VLDFQEILASPTLTFEEGIAFFRGQGMLNQTLQRVVADLERAEIDYAVIGAIALNQYGYKRFTEDIDVLVTKEGLGVFQQRFVGLGYRPNFEGAKKQYRTSDTNVRLEFITAGEYPGDGKPKPVVFPTPAEHSVAIAGIRTITLKKLIELKLASGISAPDRLKDLADVQELIRLKGLGPELAQELDPSVRAKYLELQHAIAQARNPSSEVHD
jgi:hypothetical protein